MTALWWHTWCNKHPHDTIIGAADSLCVWYDSNQANNLVPARRRAAANAAELALDAGIRKQCSHGAVITTTATGDDAHGL
jgi:hypothetical protein